MSGINDYVQLSKQQYDRLIKRIEVLEKDSEEIHSQLNAHYEEIQGLRDLIDES